MSLEKSIEVVTKLAEKGPIKQYAIAGAVAALNYIHPTLSVADFEEHKSGLILLTPIESALGEMGYSKRSEVGIWIEGWPVQFLPVASPLDEEALANAVDVEFPGQNGPFKARVLRAEYLVATAKKQ